MDFINIPRVAAATAGVLLLLAAGEWGRRKGWLSGELGRKFLHISAGTFVAFWPWFLSWTEIRLLSLGAFICIVVSLRLGVFRVVHNVPRVSYGEVMAALAVGLLTVITDDRAIYATALLQMGLADGFAAVLGSRFGRGNTYHIFDHSKSVVGTAVFVVISVTLLIGYSLLSGHGLPVLEIAAGAAVAALLENVAPLGLDNLTVPLFIAWLLTTL